MDFENAIAAHRKWKSRLRVQIDGSSTEMLDPDLIDRDDQCDLGRWIHAEGIQTMHAKPEFQALVQAHAQFHHVASKVVQMSKAGNHHEACLALDGPFYRASIEVIATLEQCKSACTQDPSGPVVLPRLR